MSPGRPTNGFARKVGDSSSVSTLSVSRIQTNSSVDPAAAVARDHVNPVASKKRALSPEITHALDAANNGLLVESGSSKRQRTALDVGSRGGFKNIEIWQVNLKSAFTEGVYWGSGAHGELFLGFDTLSQTIVVCHRGESVLSTDPLFTVKPENISKIIRPNLHRGENLHVRLELKNEHHSSRAFDFVVRTGRGYDVLLRQIRLMTCCLEETLDEYVKSSRRFTLTL